MSPAARPVFLGGASRSGKTLVRWMLYPRIDISRRTQLWSHVYGRFGDLARPENLDRCLTAMSARRRVADLGLDRERIRSDLLRDGPSYERLFALVHEHHLEQSGKGRWGDQTELIERFADQIVAAYPGARIVHLMRDPRDRYAAIVEKAGRRLGGVGAAIAEWCASAGMALSNQERHREAYLVVRYEDLVARTEDTGRRLCAFLGEAYDPRMVRLEGARRYDAQRGTSRHGIPISTASVGHYRRVVRPSEVALIQRLAAGRMRAFGYGPEPADLGLAEATLGAAVVWPPSVARWMLRRTPQPNSAPSQAGRT